MAKAGSTEKVVREVRLRPALIISHVFKFRFLGKEGTMALVGKCAFVVGLVIAVAGGLAVCV